MDEYELCKVGDFGLLRETSSSRDDDEEKHYMMQVCIYLELLLHAGMGFMYISWKPSLKGFLWFIFH